MATATASIDQLAATPLANPIAVPVSEILPWATFVALLAAVMIYFVGAEQGAISLLSGAGVHEFVHDARHLLGFPCH